MKLNDKVLENNLEFVIICYKFCLFHQVVVELGGLDKTEG